MFMLPLLDVALPLLLAFAPEAHPHYPKALTMKGAAGDLTVTYFTVPFNAEQLATGDRPGFKWHLGFAGFKTDVPLQAGESVIAPGDYKLNVIRGEKAGDWTIQLDSMELLRAKGMVTRAKRRGEGVQKAEADLATLMEKASGEHRMLEMELPTADFKGVHEEHLTMYTIFRGYSTVRARSTDPKDGMELTLRIEFGDLHKEVVLKEVFEPKK